MKFNHVRFLRRLDFSRHFLKLKLTQCVESIQRNITRIHDLYAEAIFRSKLAFSFEFLQRLRHISTWFLHPWEC